MDAPATRADPQADGGCLGKNWDLQQDQARHAVDSEHFLPLDRVIAEIRKRDAGYQLDSCIEQFNGRAVYRVRWASSNGRRIDYIVDAVSGAILQTQ